MENFVNGHLANTTFSLVYCEDRPYLLVQYIGLRLGFDESQWIKYYLFRWKPFLKREYHLIFDLAPYCKVTEEGWRLLLLIRRWLNYTDHEVFLANEHEDVKKWKKRFKMGKFFRKINFKLMSSDLSDG